MRARLDPDGLAVTAITLGVAVEEIDGDGGFAGATRSAGEPQKSIKAAWRLLKKDAPPAVGHGGDNGGTSEGAGGRELRLTTLKQERINGPSGQDCTRRQPGEAGDRRGILAG